MSKAYTVPTPFGLRIDTQKDVKTWPKSPPGLDKSSSIWRSFKSAPKHAMLSWSADFSVVYCLAFWLLAILSLQSQLVSDYALCDTQDKIHFSQANFQQHFFTSTFSTTFYQRDFPQVLPFIARFSCLSGNLDILYYKAYILLFLLEISSALAQNIIKVGRKTFMPGKI